MAHLGSPPVDATVLSDPGIPTLEAVLDPVTMGRHLRQALPERWAAIHDIRFEILKRHRTRCTFEIAVRAAEGSDCLIGKVYAADRHDVYRAMAEIRRGGFGPEAEFSIPEPLAYVPELHLLLQEKVQGPRAKHVLLTGSERDRADAAERCARWLARFQATGPRLGEADRVDDHLQSFRQWSQGLADVGGPLADKAGRLCAQLETAGRRLHPLDLCAGHGHYTGGQILLAEGRTVTVDWDGYDVADPGRDVARFLVDLKRIGSKNRDALPVLDRAAQLFLEAYLSQAGPAVRANLPFYAAALCLRLAHKDIDHHAAGWSQKAAAMLDEALRVLEQGV